MYIALSQVTVCLSFEHKRYLTSFGATITTVTSHQESGKLDFFHPSSELVKRIKAQLVDESLVSWCKCSFICCRICGVSKHIVTESIGPKAVVLSWISSKLLSSIFLSIGILVLNVVMNQRPSIIQQSQDAYAYVHVKRRAESKDSKVS